TPSPQVGSSQVVRQASASVSELASPSSHASWPAQTNPSPQVGSEQSERQSSVSSASASSHSSSPAATPSPQTGSDSEESAQYIVVSGWTTVREEGGRYWRCVVPFGVAPAA